MRKYDRIKLIYYLRVYDRASHQIVGSLVDISENGLRLLSDRPLDEGRDYALKMQLPHGSMWGEDLDMDAKTVWCKKDDDSGDYHTGFELSNIREEMVRCIQSLIADYQKKGAI